MNVLRLPLAIVQLVTRSVLLALAQVWANKGRSLLTTIGIVIGVASVTAVVAALTSLRANVLRDLESFGINKIYLFARRPDHGPKRYASWWSLRLKPDEFEHALEHCPSVKGFTRMGRRSVPVRVGQESADSRLMGVDPDWHAIENRFVTQGRPFSLIDNREARCVCIITPKIRDELRLDRDCVGQRVSIANRSFVVVGVVEAATDFAMEHSGARSNELMIPFGTYWKIYGGWLYVIAASRSPALADEAMAELRFYMRRGRRLKPGEPDTFGAEMVKKHVERFKSMATMITLIAGGIAGISLLVGGVGIMNIMLVSVSERTREIGLRKAVGARPSVILLQFLVEAITICLIGGAIGVLGGQLLTAGMAGIPNAKLQGAHIPLWAVGIAFGFALLVGVVFGMFPAIKAARLDPIEALRHE